MYFIRGRLPWQGLKADTKEEKYKLICESKRATSAETLCKGFPAVFSSYLNYCSALRFEDRPDYAYLRRLFKDLFLREGFVNDVMFDWSQPVALAGSGGDSPAAEGKQVEDDKAAGKKQRRKSGESGEKKKRSSKDAKQDSGSKPEIEPSEDKRKIDNGDLKDQTLAVQPVEQVDQDDRPVQPKKIGFIAALFSCGSKSAVKV